VSVAVDAPTIEILFVSLVPTSIAPVKVPEVAVIVPVISASTAVNNPVVESKLNLTTSTAGSPS
jgi:hypothetical protein